MGYTLIRFDDTGDGPPVAPANGKNVVFSGVKSNNDPNQLNMSAAIVGDGDAAHFLNGQGAFVTAGGGGSGPGNLVGLPTCPSTMALGGWTFWIRIPASGLLIPSAGTIKLGLLATAGPLLVNKAVIRRTLAFDPNFIDSTPITWAASSSVSLSAGLTFSDDISITVDTDHDYVVLVYTDPANTGAFAASTAGFAAGVYPFDAHRASGDFTSSAFGTLYGSINADYLVGIQQVIATP